MAQLPIKHGEVTKIVTVRMAESDVKLVKAQAKKEGVAQSQEAPSPISFSRCGTGLGGSAAARLEFCGTASPFKARHKEKVLGP